MKTSNGQQPPNWTLQMYVNNSGCCGEEEIPSEELTPNQIHKNKNGFRVKGEVKIRGRRTDRVIILPEDRYVYTATGPGAQNETNNVEFYHTSTSSELSSTIKSLFDETIRKFITRKSIVQQKVNSEVPAGDLIDETVEEDTINESLNKIYDYTSVKVSEPAVKPLKNKTDAMRRNFFKLTSCFGKSKRQQDLVQSMENFEMIIEDQCFLKELSKLKSQTAQLAIQEEELNTANKSYSEVHENRGDMKDINLVQTKSTEKSIKDILAKQAAKNVLLSEEIIRRPCDIIARSNLEMANPLKPKSSKIPIFLKYSKFIKNGGSGENYLRNLVQSKPYVDITTDEFENLQNSNQNIEVGSESLLNDSSQIEYYSELCNFHLLLVKQKLDKVYYCKNSCFQNSNNVNYNNYSTNQLFKQTKHQSDFQRKPLMSKKFEFSFRCLKDFFVHKFNNYIKSHFISSKPVDILSQYSIKKTKSYNTFGHSEFNCVTRSKNLVFKDGILSRISNSTKEIKSFLDLIIDVNPVIENSQQNLSEFSIKLSVVKFEKSFVMPIQTPFHFYNKHLFNSNNRYKILKNSKLFGMYCLGGSNELDKPNAKQLDETYRFRHGKIAKNYFRKIEKHKIVSNVKLKFSNFHSKDLSNSLENISSISTSLMDSRSLTKTKSVDYLNTNLFRETLMLEGLNPPTKDNSMKTILTNNNKTKALVDEMNSNRIPPNPRDNPSKPGKPFELNDKNPKNTLNFNLHSEIKLIATVTGKNEPNPNETNAHVFRYNFENDKSSEIGSDFHNEVNSFDSTIIYTSPFKSEIQVFDEEDPQIQKLNPIKKEELSLKPSKISANSTKRFNKTKRSNSDIGISVDVKDLKVSHLKVSKTPSERNSFTKPNPFLSKRQKSDSTIGPYYEMLSETAPFENYAYVESLDKVKPKKTTNSKSKIHSKIKEIRKTSVSSFSIRETSNVKFNVKNQEQLKIFPREYECHVDSLCQFIHLSDQTHNFDSSITTDVNILINQLKDSNRLQEKFYKKIDKENIAILEKLGPKPLNHKRLSDFNGKFDFPKRLSSIPAEFDNEPIKLQEPKLFSHIKTVNKPIRNSQLDKERETRQELNHDSIDLRQSKSYSNCDCGDRGSKDNENYKGFMKNLVLCRRNESNQLEIVRGVNNFQRSHLLTDKNIKECSRGLCCCLLCLENSGNLSKQTMETCECRTYCCCQCPRHKTMMPKYYCATVSQGNSKSCNNIISLKNFQNSNAVSNLMLNSYKSYRIENIEFNNNNINYLWSNQVFYHDPRSNLNFNFSQKLPICELPRKLENPIKRLSCYGSSISVPLCKINHYCETKPRNRLERINFVRRKINLSKLTNISDVPTAAMYLTASKDHANSMVLESLITENPELLDKNAILYSSFGFLSDTKTLSTDRALYQPIPLNNIIISKSFDLSSHKYLSSLQSHSYTEHKNIIDIEQNRNLSDSIIDNKDDNKNYLNVDNASVSSRSSVDKNMEIRPSLMSDRQSLLFEKYQVTPSQNQESDSKSPKNELLGKNGKKASNKYEINEKQNESAEISDKYNLVENMISPSPELNSMNYKNPPVPMEPLNSSLHEDGFQHVVSTNQGSMESIDEVGFDISRKPAHISKSTVNTDENRTAQNSPSKLSHLVDPDQIIKVSSSLSDEKSSSYSIDSVEKIAEERSNSDFPYPPENRKSSNKTNEKVSKQYSDISFDGKNKNSYIDNSSISIQNNIHSPSLVISSRSSNKTKEKLTLIPSQNSVNKNPLIKNSSTLSSERYDTNANIRKSSVSSTESNETPFSRNSQLSKDRKVQPSSFREVSTDGNLIQNLSLNKKNIRSSKTSTTEESPVIDKKSSRSSKFSTSGKLEKSPVNDIKSSRSSKLSTSGKLEISPVNDIKSSRSSKLSTSGKLEISPVNDIKSSRSSKLSTSRKLEKSPVTNTKSSRPSHTSTQENYKIPPVLSHKSSTTSNKTKTTQYSHVTSPIPGELLIKSNSPKFSSKNSSRKMQPHDKKPSKSSQIYNDSKLYYLEADITKETPPKKQEIQLKPEQDKVRNPTKSSQSYDSKNRIVSDNWHTYKPNPIEDNSKLKSPKKYSSHNKPKHKRQSKNQKPRNNSESINEMSNQRLARSPQSFQQVHHDPNKLDQKVSKSTQKYESADMHENNKNIIKPIDTSRVDKIFDKLLHYSTVKRESLSNKEINHIHQVPHHNKTRTSKTAYIELLDTQSSSNEHKDKNPSNSFHKYSLSNNCVGLINPFSASVTSLNFNDLMNNKLVNTTVFAKYDSCINKIEITFEKNGKENSRFSDKFNSPNSNTPECFDRESQKKCSAPSFMTVKNTTYMTAKDKTDKIGKINDSVLLNLNLLQIPYQNFCSSSTESLSKK